MRRTHDKKGRIVGETITLFATTMFVMILLFVFFILIRSMVRNADTDALAAFSDSHSMKKSLEAYVMTPVEVQYNGQNVNVQMSDLIRLAKADSSYKELLEKETGEIFNAMYGEEKYRIEIPATLYAGKAEAPKEAPTEYESQTSAVSGKITKESHYSLKMPDFNIDLYLQK